MPRRRGGRDTLRRHTGFKTRGHEPLPQEAGPPALLRPLLPSASSSAISLMRCPQPRGHDSKRLVVTLQTHGRDIIYILGL